MRNGPFPRNRLRHHSGSLKAFHGKSRRQPLNLCAEPSPRTRFLRSGPLLQTESCLFRLGRGQPLSTKWAKIEARNRPANQKGHALPLDRHLRPDRSGRAVTGLGRTEEACPLPQPLIKSVRAALVVHWPRMLGHSHKKDQSFVFKSSQRL